MYKMSMMPMFTAEAIHECVEAMAGQIRRNYEFDVVVGILTGSFIFVSDLCRYFPRQDLQIKFIKASSYCDEMRPGELEVSGLDLKELAGKRVLLIDDILDTGRTLKCLNEKIRAAGAAAVKTCALLDKPSRREVDFQADFTGFKIEDKFVVGYGLDYAGEYRTFPDIWSLEEEQG